MTARAGGMAVGSQIAIRSCSQRFQASVAIGNAICGRNGRPITAANQISGHSSRSEAGSGEIHVAIEAQGSHVCYGPRESTHLSLDRNCGEGCYLGCAPLVAVVKTANLRYGSNRSKCRRVHGPRVRRILGQREVRPGFVIIGHESFQVAVHPASLKTITCRGTRGESCRSRAPRRLAATGIAVLTVLPLFPWLLHLSKTRLRRCRRDPEAYTEGVCSNGKASRSCCAVHSAVG